MPMKNKLDKPGENYTYFIIFLIFDEMTYVRVGRYIYNV